MVSTPPPFDASAKDTAWREWNENTILALVAAMEGVGKRVDATGVAAGAAPQLIGDATELFAGRARIATQQEANGIGVYTQSNDGTLYPMGDQFNDTAIMTPKKVAQQIGRYVASRYGYGREVKDWNNDTGINTVGFYFSYPGALNAPGSSSSYYAGTLVNSGSVGQIGHSGDGGGSVMELYEYQFANFPDPPDVLAVWRRAGGGSWPHLSNWVRVDVQDASTTVSGKVELATNAETQTGSDTSRAVTPAGLASLTATESRAGLIEIATTAETTAGTDDTRAVTPLKLKQVIDAIPPGGGGSFTPVRTYDWDNATTPGQWWSSGSSVVNGPYEATLAGTVVAAGSRLIQEVSDGAASLATLRRTWRRIYTGTAWTSWYETTPDATETTAGMSEIATTAEVVAGTDDARTVTPLKLKGRMDFLRLYDTENIAYGSDFEDLATIPWTMVSGRIATSTTQSRSGVRSIAMTGAAGNASSNFIPGDISVAEGETILFELWARRNSAWDGTTANSRLRIADQNNSPVAALAYDAASVSTSSWTRLTRTYTVPAGVTALKIGLFNDANNGNVWIDDIVIRRLSGGNVVARVWTGSAYPSRIPGFTNVFFGPSDPGLAMDAASDYWAIPNATTLTTVVAQANNTSSALYAAIQNATTKEIWIGADELAADSTSTASLLSRGTSPNQHVAYSMPTGSVSRVYGSFKAPESWSSFRIRCHWYKDGSGTGNATFITTATPAAQGASIYSGGTSLSTTQAVGGNGTVMDTVGAGSISVIGGTPVPFMVARNQTAGSDTFGAAIYLLGVVVERVS